MRKRNSKAWWLSLALGITTLAVAGAGCGADDNGGASGGDKQITIGFSQATLNHPYRVAMVEGNKKWASQHGVKLVVTDGQDNPAKQVADIQSLVSRGVDALMVSPVQEDALTPAVKAAMDRGIPVITMDRAVKTKVTEHIGGDNRDIGVKAADYLAGEVLKGNGNVIEIQGTAGASATIERHEGFTAEVKAKYPGVKIVATQFANYERQKAQKYMEDQLQRFGKAQIQAVYAHNDEMALGAIQALEQAGRLGEVKVVGIDGQNNAIQAVKAGKLAGTFIYPTVAPEGAAQAAKVARGAKVPAKLVLKTTRVDPANVDQWIGKGI